MTQRYTVSTEDNGNGWSYIEGPNGYREGPIRYRDEAQQWADEMNNGKPPPSYMRPADGQTGGPKKEVSDEERGEIERAP